MHGIVFEELREYVWRTHGAQAWSDLLKEAAPDRRFYAPDRAYPDEELEGLISAASKKTGASRSELLFDFGTFIAPTLLDLYRPLISPDWDLLGFLEHVEETIHRVVRLDDPTAAPPRLGIERVAEDLAVIKYDSPRNMCDLAKGIVTGLQKEYDQAVELRDVTCMKHGDPLCTIEVHTLLSKHPPPS